MKYFYFLLKLRPYNWRLTIMGLILFASLTTNIILSITLARHHPTTIFVPTQTHETFVFHQTFSPLYFERMGSFISQHLFSFYRDQSHHLIEPLLLPTQKDTLLSRLNQWLAPYRAHNIQGIFTPSHVQCQPDHTVKVTGTLRLFVGQELLHTKELSVTLSFHVVHGQCFLSHWALTPEQPHHTP